MLEIEVRLAEEHDRVGFYNLTCLPAEKCNVGSIVEEVLWSANDLLVANGLSPVAALPPEDPREHKAAEAV